MALLSTFSKLARDDSKVQLCMHVQVMHGRETASKEEAASEESVAGAGNAAELGVETVGSLDLGGSSLEVTFLPTSKSVAEATSACCFTPEGFLCL